MYKSLLAEKEAKIEEQAKEIERLEERIDNLLKNFPFPRHYGCRGCRMCRCHRVSFFVVPLY